MEVSTNDVKRIWQDPRLLFRGGVALALWFAMGAYVTASLLPEMAPESANSLTLFGGAVFALLPVFIKFR